jgi:hypothetical protein
LIIHGILRLWNKYILYDAENNVLYQDAAKAESELTSEQMEYFNTYYAELKEYVDGIDT